MGSAKVSGIKPRLEKISCYSIHAENKLKAQQKNKREKKIHIATVTEHQAPAGGRSHPSTRGYNHRGKEGGGLRRNNLTKHTLDIHTISYLEDKFRSSIGTYQAGAFHTSPHCVHSVGVSGQMAEPSAVSYFHTFHTLR